MSPNTLRETTSAKQVCTAPDAPASSTIRASRAQILALALAALAGCDSSTPAPTVGTPPPPPPACGTRVDVELEDYTLDQTGSDGSQRLGIIFNVNVTPRDIPCSADEIVKMSDSHARGGTPRDREYVIGEGDFDGSGRYSLEAPLPSGRGTPDIPVQAGVVVTCDCANTDGSVEDSDSKSMLP